jgi:uncharacterized protein
MFLVTMMSRIMSNAPLPSQLDVRKLAVKGAEISAFALVSTLPRVVDMLADKEGKINVTLRFYIDEQRHKCIEGHLQGVVQVFCQRCLEPMSVNVDMSFQLGIVWSEEKAEKLPSSLEPLIVGEELTNLADVVSDELILNLPYVNYHHPEDCKQSVGFSSVDPETIELLEKTKDNPFNVLAQLKSDKYVALNKITID